MSKYTKMEVVMVVGIIMVSFMSMTSKAQDALPCWDRIGACVGSATSAEAVEQCCEVVAEEISDERECFCGVKPLLDQNATVADGISQLLMICSISSFDTLCPDSSSSVGSPPAEAPTSPVEFHEEPCWQMISDCVGDNVNRSESDPQFDPSSPSFNATELLCCPLIQETAVTEKQCFCTVNTFILENPSHAENMTQLLSVCGIPDSDALNAYCLGEAPSPAPALAPVPVSMTPTPGSTESLASKTPSAKNASGAIKIKTTGSLSSLLVLLTYVLFR